MRRKLLTITVLAAWIFASIPVQGTDVVFCFGDDLHFDFSIAHKTSQTLCDIDVLQDTHHADCVDVVLCGEDVRVGTERVKLPKVSYPCPAFSCFDNRPTLASNGDIPSISSSPPIGLTPRDHFTQTIRLLL